MNPIVIPIAMLVILVPAVGYAFVAFKRGEERRRTARQPTAGGGRGDERPNAHVGRGLVRRLDL